VTGAWWPRLLRWFQGTSPPRNLSADQVLAKAREAALAAGYAAENLELVIPAERNGRLLWHVTDAVRGASLLVQIDDASAEVLSIERFGGR
jgi:hypothetical protein